MDVLFILTGFIFASAIPFVHYDFLQAKGTIFYFIMLLFAILVIAYVILSISKFYISRLDYLKNTSIIFWNHKEKAPEKKSFKPFVFSLIIGLVAGITVYFNKLDILCCILLSIALALIVLGFWLMGIKRFYEKKAAMPDFVLSHNGMLYNEKPYIFNGYSKGISDIKRENNTLVFKLIKGKKVTDINLTIPEDKIEAVDEFLNDLTNHLNGVSDENQ